MTVFNGTVKKAVLYSLITLIEKIIYLTHGWEKEKKIKQCNCNNVSGNLVSSIYFRVIVNPLDQILTRQKT